MGGTLLGELEHRILLALLALGPEAYSVSVAEHLDERTGMEVALATIHVSLRRLEDKGLVRSELRRGPVAEGGRQRRCYEVLEAGRVRLRAARRELDALWEAAPGLGSSS
ncbi:MAG TPA: helix-turn-helix transcriptional regulator [Longimicrobiales bacterium]|jgi:DNA-binding PadR family transcriptional regulator|nr:helix-turn-helix transcriptional regulator [Longimicrobiales bacterium]